MGSAVWRTALLSPLSATGTASISWSWLDDLDPGFGPGLSFSVFWIWGVFSLDRLVGDISYIGNLVFCAGGCGD